MAKTVSPDPKPPIEENSLSPAAAHIGFGQRVFAVVKFILGLFMLIFVYSFAVSFLGEFLRVEETARAYFWSGAAGFIGFYLFVYEPVIVYRKGQRIIEVIFRFFAPLVKVAPYLLPVYALVLSVLYLVISLLFRSSELLRLFLFLFGASLALHLVFGSKTLRGKKADFLKANYTFGFSFVCLLTVTLAALVLSALFDKFSFVSFATNSFGLIGEIVNKVLRQLFLVA